MGDIFLSVMGGIELPATNRFQGSLIEDIVAGRGFHFHPGHISLVINQRPEQHFPLPAALTGLVRIFRFRSEAISGWLDRFLEKGGGRCERHPNRLRKGLRLGCRRRPVGGNGFRYRRLGGDRCGGQGC